MQSHVYKRTEIVGTSTTGIDHAVASALARAGETVRNIRYFEVVQTRGTVDSDGKVDFQVVVKIEFALEDPVVEPPLHADFP